MHLDTYKNQIHVPQPQSRKGDNGKLLIIGGSSLFHAASAWSLDIASRMVDMVFYSSLPENNELIKEVKKKFWDGVVVPRGEVRPYLEEADCVLIGPGMTRDSETETLTNELLKSYPTKKWVIDAGALQMADASLFTSSMIVTPHHQEYVRVFGGEATHDEDVMMMSKMHNNVVIVLKGHEDVISDGRMSEVIQGGNGGMTKGGTGDVLAGLIASFYCTSPAFASAIMGSVVNKKAGDALFQKVGPFFNTSDLIHQLQETLTEQLILSTV